MSLVSASDEDSSLYSYEVKCSDKVVSSLIGKSVDINFLGRTIPNQKDEDAVLVFKMTFSPSKAFK